MNQHTALSVPDRGESEPRYAELDLAELRGRQGTIAHRDCIAVFHGVSYDFLVKRKRVVLLSQLSFGIPRGRKIVLLGHKGSGKSSFLEVLGNKIAPSKGRVTRNGTISWPLNLTPFFVPILSVRDNLVFAARVMLLQSPRYVVERAAYFGELEPGDLERPMASLPAEIRRRIGFSLGLMAQFDLHLFDSAVRPMPFGFNGPAGERFLELVFQNDYLISQNNSRQIPPNCDLLYILYQGQIYMFDDIELGKKTFNALPEPSEAELERTSGDGDGGAQAGLEAF